MDGVRLARRCPCREGNDGRCALAQRPAGQRRAPEISDRRDVPRAPGWEPPSAGQPGEEAWVPPSPPAPRAAEPTRWERFGEPTQASEQTDPFAATRPIATPTYGTRPPDEPSPPIADGPTDEGSKNELLRFFGELPVLIALALGIALLIKAFLVQPFYIEQESMTPTLHPSERVLVSKLNYRFGDPRRGDVVIFHNPRGACDRNPDAPQCNPGLGRRMFDWIIQTFGLPTSTSDDLVKRIVALPGETVAMRDGEVYVCQTPGCQPLDADGSPKDGLLVAFQHTDVKGPQKDNDDIDAVTVPEDQYYVLGDNRDGSVDSRVFGTVPRKDFVGKVVVLLWPPTRWQGL